MVYLIFSVFLGCYQNLFPVNSCEAYFMRIPIPFKWSRYQPSSNIFILDCSTRYIYVWLPYQFRISETTYRKLFIIYIFQTGTLHIDIAKPPCCCFTLYQKLPLHVLYIVPRYENTQFQNYALKSRMFLVLQKFT